MRVDLGRLLLVLIGFLVAQILIQTFLSLLGISGIAFIVIYNLLLSFVAVLIYYPAEYRSTAFKNPEFYRNVSIFFLVFLILSLIGF